MEPNEPQPLFGLTIDSATSANLRETARWARFLSIVGFIGMGLVVLMILFVMLAMPSLPAQDYPGYQAQMPMMAREIYIVMVVVFAALYIFPLISLYRFGTQMKQALIANDQMNLNSAFRNLKAMFRFIGILTIVVLSLYALVFLMMIVFGAAASL